MDVTINWGGISFPEFRAEHGHKEVSISRNSQRLALIPGVYSRPQQTRALIMDGHDSHVSWQFLNFRLQHDIIPFCLPAHSTHLLQPLDIGLFSLLQQHYSACLDDWLEWGQTGLNMGDFYP